MAVGGAFACGTPTYTVADGAHGAGLLPLMLAGIYYGAQYGDSTTAILANLPGESSSIVTGVGGYLPHPCCPPCQ